MIERLLELKDEAYGDFQAKLTPGVDRSTIIGVRIPLLRKLAKEIYKSGEYKDLLKSLPCKFYDETMLCGLAISEIKDYVECVDAVERILPYVDNWAICDILSPKVFKKHRKELIEKIYEWSASDETYTCRFGLEMLMTHFLDSDYKKEYLDIPANIKSEEYYINMMIAWFYATALAKKWDDTIEYIVNQRLDKWTHNKTIQKAVESRRISNEQKDYLRTLRIK